MENVCNNETVLYYFYNFDFYNLNKFPLFTFYSRTIDCCTHDWKSKYRLDLT